MRSRNASAGLILLLWAGAGCGSPFPPETLVERLRILGVRAEPPEADPSTVVELDALVADPAGEGRPVECTWAVCLLELGGEAQEIDCPGEDSYPIEGSCDAARLEMPALVAWLAAQGFDLDDLPEDLPVDELPLYLGLDVRAGPARTRAIKRIRVAPEPRQDANTNPVLEGLKADARPVDGGAQLVAGTNVVLEPLAAPASRQRYRPEGEEGEEILEDFLFSWFSTCGVLEDERTILDVAADGSRLDLNTWKLPEREEPCTLWVVLRDGRYGIDWMSFDFEITAGAG